MNYKRVFLDANVILDVYDEKRTFHTQSSDVISVFLQYKDIELFTSCDIITTLYYVLSKKGKMYALDSILDVNELCTLIEFANLQIDESCNLMKKIKNLLI